MRVAIVHDSQIDTTPESLIVESLERVIPTAEVVHCGEATDWRAGSASRILPTSHRLTRARIAEADFVLSTSRAAANFVPLRPGRLHVCYLTSKSVSKNSTSQTPMPPSRLRATPLAEFPRVMAAVGLSPVLVDRFSPPPTSRIRRSITHFLAGSGSVARSLREETGCPVKVIPPPVAIEQYPPSKQRRADHYVTTAERRQTSALDLAIEACRLAQRKLVVLAESAQQLPHYAHAPSHVQFLVAPSVEERHRQLNGCRALLCAGDVDYAPIVIAAQACGTPVIVPAHSGAAETVVDAEGEGQGTGIFFEGMSPESLASAMRELEQRPHKVSASLAWANALKFSSERFERDMTEFLEAVRVASSFAANWAKSISLSRQEDRDRPAA